MEFFGIDWDKKHILKTDTVKINASEDSEINIDEIKKEIEPWLSAILKYQNVAGLYS